MKSSSVVKGIKLAVDEVASLASIYLNLIYTKRKYAYKSLLLRMVKSFHLTVMLIGNGADLSNGVIQFCTVLAKFIKTIVTTNIPHLLSANLLTGFSHLHHRWLGLQKCPYHNPLLPPFCFPQFASYQCQCFFRLYHLNGFRLGRLPSIWKEILMLSSISKKLGKHPVWKFTGKDLKMTCRPDKLPELKVSTRCKVKFIRHNIAFGAFFSLGLCRKTQRSYSDLKYHEGFSAFLLRFRLSARTPMLLETIRCQSPVFPVLMLPALNYPLRL